MVIFLLISSGSKSRFDVPSSTLPSLVVAFPSNRMASAREVLPEPPCATRATFLNCSAFFSILKPFPCHEITTVWVVETVRIEAITDIKS